MGRSGQTVIFDLDGTLIPNTSAEKNFLFHLLRNRILSIISIIQLLPAIWTARGNLHEMTLLNKRYLKNRSVRDFEDIAKQYFEPLIDTLIFPFMTHLINEHRKNGDQILLLTGTLDFIAGCFARHLFIDGYKATMLEIRDGRFTGRVVGIQPFGLGKLEVLRDLKREYNFNSDNAVLYANIYADRYVMNAVARPIAVNPDKRLLNYALRSKWRIINPNPAEVTVYSKG
jgi:putative phosphoserine phosphatase/1-acylglycerol-3-phosphate O-acyltransferase